MEKKVIQKIILERQKKRLTLEEVAKATHISVKFLEAIEENRLDLFPSYVYFVAYFKSYVHFLGLDPYKLLKNYNHIDIKTEKDFFNYNILLDLSEKKIIRRHQHILWKIILFCLIFGLIGSIVLTRSFWVRLWYQLLPQNTLEKTDNQNLSFQKKIAKSKIFYFNIEDIQEKTFILKKKNYIYILVQGNIYPIQILSIDQYKLVMDINEKKYTMLPNEPFYYDVNQDKKSDFFFMIQDLESSQVSLHISYLNNLNLPSLNMDRFIKWKTLKAHNIYTASLQFHFLKDVWVYYQYKNQNVEKLYQAGDSLIFEIGSTLTIGLSNTEYVRYQIDEEEMHPFSLDELVGFFRYRWQVQDDNMSELIMYKEK